MKNSAVHRVFNEQLIIGEIQFTFTHFIHLFRFHSYHWSQSYNSIICIRMVIWLIFSFGHSRCMRQFWKRPRIFSCHFINAFILIFKIIIFFQLYINLSNKNYGQWRWFVYLCFVWRNRFSFQKKKHKNLHAPWIIPSSFTKRFSLYKLIFSTVFSFSWAFDYFGWPFREDFIFFFYFRYSFIFM